jgi:hypothetical protein
METNYTELAKAKLLEMGLKGLANHTSIPKMMGEICRELVKNCNAPAVSESVEPVGWGTVDCDTCLYKTRHPALYPCCECDEGYHMYEQATGR